MTLLTYIPHIVDTVAGPLAANDFDSNAGDTKEHSHCHAETNDKAQVCHHYTNTISSKVGICTPRSTHASSATSTNHIFSPTEMAPIYRTWLTAGPSLLMSAIRAACGP